MSGRGRTGGGSGGGLTVSYANGVFSASFGGLNTGTVQWYRDSGSGPVAIGGATGLTYNKQSADDGKPITARSTSIVLVSPPVVVAAAGAALAIAGTPITTANAGTAYAGFTAAASGGEAPYAYSVVNGPAGMVVNASGQVTYPNPAQGTYNGISIRATDAAAAVADLTFSLVVSAAASVPTNTVAPTITGTPQVGVQLNGVHGTWTGSPTGYVYQWKRGATVVATTQNYTPVSGDVGSPLTFSELASNAAGPAAGYATSAATANVAAAAASTVPRQAQGPGTATAASLFAASTVLANGSSGSRAVSSFTAAAAGSNAGVPNFNSVFILASACVPLGGAVYSATFTDVNGTGGWSGTTPTNATPTTTNGGASDSASKSNDTFTDSGSLWVRFRMDYGGGAAFSGSIS